MLEGDPDSRLSAAEVLTHPWVAVRRLSLFKQIPCTPDVACTPQYE